MQGLRLLVTPRYHAALAPRHRPPPLGGAVPGQRDRPTSDPPEHTGPGPPPGAGEPRLGIPQNPRGTGRAGRKDRGAGHLGDPQNHRHRPRAATDRASLAAVPASRCQCRIVSGVTSSRSTWRRALGYHGEQNWEQGTVCPVQPRATWLPPLQDGQLVAQDQDLRGLPRLLTLGQPQPRCGPRNQEEHEPQARDR